MANERTRARVATGPFQHHQAALAEGRILLQRCAACAAVQYYPRAVCAACGSDRLDWCEASGDGVVYAASVVRRKPEAGGDYSVVLVDLAEGARMMSCVTGVAPSSVRIGDKVRAGIDRSAAQPRIVFTRRDAP